MKKIFFINIITFCLLFIGSCTKEQKTQREGAIIPPENVMNIAATKRAQAVITGERKNVEVATETTDVWTLTYTDDNNNIHSTIIKQNPENNMKIGDTLVIYYDETNPASLPIYESQYKSLMSQQ